MIWEHLQSILVSAGVSAATAIGVFAFLARRMIEQRLARKMERYKSELSQKTETLKTQLSIYAHEQNVAATRVDAQRTHAIGSVFAAFCRFSKPLSRLVAGSPIENATTEHHLQYYNDFAEQAYAAGKDLSNELTNNAIYLDVETYTQLAEAVTASLHAVAQFLSPIREGLANSRDVDRIMERVQAQQEQLAKLHKELLQPLHQEVVAEFREILGVNRHRDASAT